MSKSGYGFHDPAALRAATGVLLAVLDEDDQAADAIIDGLDLEALAAVVRHLSVIWSVTMTAAFGREYVRNAVGEDALRQAGIANTPTPSDTAQ